LFQSFAVFADLRNVGIAKPQPVLEVQGQGDDDGDQRFNGNPLALKFYELGC